jgi:hypothetical protein
MKAWALLLFCVLLLGATLGWFAWITLHAAFPTGVEITNCHRTYGCTLSEMRR